MRETGLTRIENRRSKTVYRRAKKSRQAREMERIAESKKKHAGGMMWNVNAATAALAQGGAPGGQTVLAGSTGSGSKARNLDRSTWLPPSSFCSCSRARQLRIIPSNLTS